VTLFFETAFIAVVGGLSSQSLNALLFTAKSSGGMRWLSFLPT